MKKFKSVDEFIAHQEYWQEELVTLRDIMLSTDMEEGIKWNFPVYMVNGKNVAGLGAFKSYFGIWFFQGALLEDTKAKLINAQEGKTHAMRQWRFNSSTEIDESLIRLYLEEAIENQRAGRAIQPSPPRKKPLVMPEKLTEALQKTKGAMAAFDSLSLSKKRDYAEYIAEAKRESTKEKRLQKIIPMILQGQGLNDRYK